MSKSKLQCTICGQPVHERSNGWKFECDCAVESVPKKEGGHELWGICSYDEDDEAIMFEDLSGAVHTAEECIAIRYRFLGFLYEEHPIVDAQPVRCLPGTDQIEYATHVRMEYV